MRAKYNCIVLSLLLLIGPVGHAVTPISISQFENKAGYSNCRYGWDWWQKNLGEGFKEMLSEELLKSKNIELYERETIGKIYENEHSLVNSEEDQVLKKGKFKKAKYTFVGAVTDFEYCSSKKSGSVNVGAVAGFFGVSAPDIEIGLKGASAKIGIDVRVIDTQTGRVIKTVHTTSQTEDRKFNLDTDYGDFSSQENSPMGEAARSAISKASALLLEALKF